MPVVYSTPQTDWGWVYEVSCGDPGVVRFLHLISEPRQPSPCSSQTPAASCVPGLNPAAFVSQVQGQVPPEALKARPPTGGVVGVPVEIQLQPTPVTEFAEIDLSVPDLGDADPGEVLHVVWVVEASPEVVSWNWPDGTHSTNSTWIPQTDSADGTIQASLLYEVTASGFWSDGAGVHALPTVTVGRIPVASQLAYPVQQVQPALG